MNINKSFYAGRIGNISMKATPSGLAICEFSVASNERRKDKTEVTTWMKCKAFGKTAETISAFFQKGDRIYVEGKLSVSNWESKSGEKHTSTEIVVNSFEFVDGKSSANKSAQETSSEQSQAHAMAAADGDDWGDLDDDIGF